MDEGGGLTRQRGGGRGYHNQLRREADGWKISRLLLEIRWGERRVDATGYLAEVGGPGPQVCPR
ncbi:MULTISPECIES: hypothetical protein [unclassified Frankia]|uniref:hypothetical protein n=1 Tax=unclassified Frankia TaxID=2632575 RepID=UPI001EF3E6CE|nr:MULTISPECIES: hypothetical protein [unclassified Frankia]